MTSTKEIHASDTIAALNESNTIHRAIMASVLDPLVTIDSRGIVLAASDSVEQVFGWKPDELVGNNISVLMPLPHQAEHNNHLQKYCKTGSSKVLGMVRELKATRKDGTVFPCEIRANRVDIPGKTEPLFAGIIRDISETKAAEEQIHLHASQLIHANRQLLEAGETLRKTAEEAGHANQAKSAFLANMSHEIRTPMNAILGFSRRLLKEPLTPNQLKKIRFVYDSGQELMTLIDDILDISKIEAGKVELSFVDLDLHLLVKDAVELVSPLAAEKQLDISCDISPEVPRLLQGDETRLRQILVNLLGNAVKFTKHGNIGVKVSTEEQEEKSVTVRIEVSDTGIGIPADRFQKIFETFTQADTSTTREFGGSGLGLTICKRLVEMMQGKISVQSELGIGSTFCFTVVLNKQSTESAASDDDLGRNDRDENESKKKDGSFVPIGFPVPNSP